MDDTEEIRFASTDHWTLKQGDGYEGEAGEDEGWDD
jgi:hypothetical protein